MNGRNGGGGRSGPPASEPACLMSKAGGGPRAACSQRVKAPTDCIPNTLLQPHSVKSNKERGKDSLRGGKDEKKKHKGFTLLSAFAFSS
jgi:hypothetical protein